MNFGIAYGLTSRGLAEQLRCSPSEVRQKCWEVGGVDIPEVGWIWLLGYFGDSFLHEVRLVQWRHHSSKFWRVLMLRKTVLADGNGASSPKHLNMWWRWCEKAPNKKHFPSIGCNSEGWRRPYHQMHPYLLCRCCATYATDCALKCNRIEVFDQSIRVYPPVDLNTWPFSCFWYPRRRGLQQGKWNRNPQMAVSLSSHENLCS